MITKLFGLVILVGALAGVYLFEGKAFGSGALRILHWPAIVLTGVGPLGLILIASDFRFVLETIGIIFTRSPRSCQRRQERDALLLEKIAKRYYSEGAGVFDQGMAKNVSPLVSRVLERMALRLPQADIRELLEGERDRRLAKLHQCLGVVGLGVRLSPSVGMLGTILGMVQLLSTLEDPSHIGPAMSLALFTTFYGLFFSLSMWTPMQHKIERLMAVETDGYDQVIRWIEVLEKRKPVDYFADAAGIHPKENGREASAA